MAALKAQDLIAYLKSEGWPVADILAAMSDVGAEHDDGWLSPAERDEIVDRLREMEVTK